MQADVHGCALVAQGTTPEVRRLENSLRVLRQERTKLMHPISHCHSRGQASHITNATLRNRSDRQTSNFLSLQRGFAHHSAASA